MSSQITIFQTNENGEFVHQGVAYELALEPGKYNVPYRAVLVPPKFAEGYKTVWHSPHCPIKTTEFSTEGEWRLEDIPVKLHRVTADGLPDGILETTLAVVGTKFEHVPVGCVLTEPPVITVNPKIPTQLRWVSLFPQDNPLYKTEGSWVNELIPPPPLGRDLPEKKLMNRPQTL